MKRSSRSVLAEEGEFEDGAGAAGVGMGWGMGSDEGSLRGGFEEVEVAEVDDWAASPALIVDGSSRSGECVLDLTFLSSLTKQADVAAPSASLAAVVCTGGDPAGGKIVVLDKARGLELRRWGCWERGVSDVLPVAVVGEELEGKATVGDGLPVGERTEGPMSGEEEEEEEGARMDEGIGPASSSSTINSSVVESWAGGGMEDDGWRCWWDWGWGRSRERSCSEDDWGREKRRGPLEFSVASCL
jgi:hypothetical protein